MSQSKTRLLELNAQLAQTLTEKGVEATADETTTALVDKVAEISGGSDDFIGIKYLEATQDEYKLPVVVDASSIAAPIDSQGNSQYLYTASLFANAGEEWYKGQFTMMRDVILPENISEISQNMFLYCTSLKNIYNTANIKKINYQSFSGCRSLNDIPIMPKLETIVSSAFKNCTGLMKLTFYNILKTWDTSAFTGCKNITEINLVNGWNTAVYAQHCPNLTQASLHDMIEKYADMTGQTSPVMNIGSTNLEKIDDEHKTIATAKNVTLA